MGAPWAAQVITVIGSLKRWRSQTEFQIAVADWMLVGGLKHFLFSIIYGIILPIDYIIFSRWLLHHQPGWISRGFHDGKWGFHRTIESQMGISTIIDDPQYFGAKHQGFRFRLSLEIHWCMAVDGAGSDEGCLLLGGEGEIKWVLNWISLQVFG